MAATPDPEAEINAIKAELSDARDRVRQGDLVDLTEFTDRIGRLCDNLTALPLDVAAAFADRLDQLADDLKGLANDVNDRREQLRDRLVAANADGPAAS